MIQKLREYFKPMIAAAVTAITVATAVICTILVGRDTLGIPLTILARPLSGRVDWYLYLGPVALSAALEHLTAGSTPHKCKNAHTGGLCGMQVAAPDNAVTCGIAPYRFPRVRLSILAKRWT